MKRIEVLTNFKDEGQFYKGEVRVVTPEKAGYYCGLGWAKDVSDGDQVATGTPDLSPKKLEVESARHASKTAIVGGK